MNLYELTESLQAAMDSLTVDEETGEVTGFEAVDALDLAFEDKAEAYAMVIKNNLAFAAQGKQEMDNLRKRVKAAENKAAHLREHLAQAMMAVGKEKVTTPRAALSFRSSTSAVVEDETCVPDDYFRVETLRKLDKVAILQRLRNGGVIPGCKLQESRNLQIK